MLIQDFVKSKSLPTFLANNKKFVACKDVKKIFPRIGLPNGSVSCAIDNKIETEEAAIELLGQVFNTAKYYAEPYNNYNKESRAIFETIRNQLVSRSLHQFISWKNGQASIRLISDIIDNDKVIFKAGDTLFKVFNALANKYNHFEIIDRWDAAKTFNALNIPNTEMKVVFSSDGADGLWDIATMSMRGFRSCQSWDGQYKARLIGSIVDPFTGIIYIATNTNTHYGAKMLNRSVVRYVVKHKEKKPILLIDKMYPALSKQALNIFSDFLSTRTSLQTIYGPDYREVASDFYIPTSTNVAKLISSTLSYRDTPIEYGHPKPNAEYDFRVKASSIRRLFKDVSIRECYKQHNLVIPNAAKTLTTQIVKQPDFKYMIQDMYNGIAQAIIATIDAKKFNNPIDYKKAILYAWFNNNTKAIIKKRLTAFVIKANDYYGYICVEHNLRLRSNFIRSLIDNINKELSKSIKDEISKIIKQQSKKRATLALP